MIGKVQPESYETAPVVVVESTAPTNDEAIREIDSWARIRGFVRSREHVLNSKLLRNGDIVYYSACYPLDVETLDAAEAAIARMNARRAAMPLTASSAELIRSDL